MQESFDRFEEEHRELRDDFFQTQKELLEIQTGFKALTEEKNNLDNELEAFYKRFSELQTNYNLCEQVFQVLVSQMHGNMLLVTFRFDYEYAFDYDYDFLESFRFDYTSVSLTTSTTFLAIVFVIVTIISSAILVSNRRTATV